MSHRLTIKGQVTIPKEIRDFLGLEEGCSCVEFVVEADGSVSEKRREERACRIKQNLRQFKILRRLSWRPQRGSNPR